MTKRNAEILLAAVIIARSTSLLFAKVGLESMGVLNLLGVRFCLAFLVLALLFWKRLLKLSRRDLLCGTLLGAAFFAVMVAEMFALKHSDASTTAFLENTAIVIVPILEALMLRKAPKKKVLLCAAITLVGVAFLTLGGSVALGVGHLLGMLTALLYAASIILTGRLSQQGDALMLGVLQVGSMGVFSLIGSFLLETPRLPMNTTEWGVILALALVCSCFGFTLQPMAQKYTSTARAAQFCALNPLAVMVLGVLFMQEGLSLSGVIGAALILLGILLQSSGQQADAPAEPDHT